LTTHLPGGKPGYSLLVIVSAEFSPVQLGLGFMLVGVGGLLGIQRTVAVAGDLGGPVPAGGGPARVRADRAHRVGDPHADHDRAGPGARAAGAGAADRARPAARA